VGHTAMMRRLGDEKGRAVLREHEQVTRNTLKTYGGSEVKTMGDGPSFTSITKGVECAIALQRAFDERNASSPEPVTVRVGLNAGEPIQEDGDVFGETVILAARIAAKAEGAEILVANAVRELCSGKGFLFADRGEFVAEGFEDPCAGVRSPLAELSQVPYRDRLPRPRNRRRRSPRPKESRGMRP
jgi:adenylate cyclase